MKRILLFIGLGLFVNLFASSVLAGEISKEQIKGLDEQVQEIKKDVLGISSELASLEEKLLYPSNTQVSVFVSFAEKAGFRLDAMDIKFDGEEVTHYVYTAREIEALRNGGVQRIYTGNISSGEHLVEVSFLGKSLLGGFYKENASYIFTKGVKPALVEIKLSDQGFGDAIEFKER